MNVLILHGLAIKMRGRIDEKQTTPPFTLVAKEVYAMKNKITAHEHAEMIKTKADNMELVVFINNYDKWMLGDLKNLVDLDMIPAFLCLPQHKEVCLHWLNGGDVQFKPKLTNLWIMLDEKSNSKWTKDSGWTMDNFQFRIKPKKEKRWIGVHKSGATTGALLIKKEVEHSPFVEQSPDNWQFIEIEIEV